jgi:hypothetical protein
VQDWEHAAAAPAAAEQAAHQRREPNMQELQAAAAAASSSNSSDTTQGGWGPAKPPVGPLHLAFAANAGLPAFPAWLPTLQQLLQLSKHADGTHAEEQIITRDAAAGMRSSSSSRELASQPVPVLFSDYCEEAAVNSQQMVQGLLGCGFDLECQLNPFRQPVGLNSHGTGLPACSNGFLFGWL